MLDILCHLAKASIGTVFVKGFTLEYQHGFELSVIGKKFEYIEVNILTQEMVFDGYY